MGWSVYSVKRFRFKMDILYVNIVGLFLVICVEFVLEVLFFSPSGDMTIHTYTHVLYLENLLASDLHNRRQKEIYFPKFCF